MTYKRKVVGKEARLRTKRNVNSVIYGGDSIEISTIEGNTILYGTPVKKQNFIANGLTCECHKDVYLTYNDALKAVKQRYGRETKYPYKCNLCGHYHLTTKETNVRKKTKYKRNKLDIIIHQNELNLNQFGDKEKYLNKWCNIKETTF
jgi:hypothetical protein